MGSVGHADLDSTTLLTLKPWIKKPSGLSQWLLPRLVLLIEREHLYSFNQNHSPVASAMHVAKHNNFALQWFETKWKTKLYCATSCLPIIPVASVGPVRPLETQFTLGLRTAVVGVHRWRPRKQSLLSLEFPTDYLWKNLTFSFHCSSFQERKQNLVFNWYYTAFPFVFSMVSPILMNVLIKNVGLGDLT